MSVEWRCCSSINFDGISFTLEDYSYMIKLILSIIKVFNVAMSSGLSMNAVLIDLCCFEDSLL